MNRYPLWKYLLILTIICLGIIYSLPNLYQPDPAIQVSGESAATTIDEKLMGKAKSVLDDAGLAYFGVEHSQQSGLIRLHTEEDQSKARELLQTALGGEYVVAVNRAPTTPEWLVGLAAGPMKLGLDLAGGVHFLLEVDTEKVIKDDLKSIESTLRKTLRKERVTGAKVRVTGQDEIIISVDSDEKRTEVTAILRKDMQELDYVRYEEQDRFLVRAKMKDTYIREKERYAVTQNLTTLRNRVNEIGVSEPLVQSQGRNRIVVELPGIQDTARAKAIIGKTANLEFRLEADASTLSSQKERFEFRNELDQAQRGGAWLEKRPIIRGDRVTNAQMGFDPETSQPEVNITLDSRGGNAMHRKTRDNIRRRMGVLFIEYKTRFETYTDENGVEQKRALQIPKTSIISLATIQSALGRNFRITGLDNPQEASELALLLRSGALAAPMSFVEERTIGPSLGKENIDLGVSSVKLGFVFVLLFMLVYYRVFGFAADIALALNLVLLVGVLSIFGATLTLPGIAGIVLTVGMAVDANVLIFSRVREELRLGLPPQTAIKSGFDRAFVTILDANVTTFIVAIILYLIGSGPVKGFAVTLAIGIVTSMFTAIMGTRAIINLIYGGRSVKKLMI